MSCVRLQPFEADLNVCLFEALIMQKPEFVELLLQKRYFLSKAGDMRCMICAV